MRYVLLLLPLTLAAWGCQGQDARCSAPPDVSELDFSSARATLKNLFSLCVIDSPLVAGSGALRPKNGAVPYDLTTPLFSDYAEKFRTIWIPPGTKIGYRDPEVFDFPVGSIITKTFSFPADLRQPTQNVRLLETRVLVRTKTVWLALPYVWNAAQTDASIDLLGSVYSEPFLDASGQTQTPSFAIPSSNQCLLCHEGTEPAHPIGPRARLLNRSYPYATGMINQLDHLVALGMLEGAPASAEAPVVPPYNDPSAGTLDDRARGWLDTNCAHCHNAKGGASSTGLFLGYTQTDPFLRGLCKPPIAAGTGTGGRAYDIVPGKPDESILTFRLEATDPGKAMPPVGRSLVHAESVAVIREWITSLPGSCN